MSRCSSPPCSPANGPTAPRSPVAGSLSSNYQPVFYPARHSPRRDEVLVGAIVKPSLGLSPQEVAATAAALAAGGADLIKDDELLGDPAWCPLEERVRAVAAVLPDGVRYAANVTGPVESLLSRARRAVELGASAVMVNAFAQGLDSLRALREAELGVPIFAHRVGAALWVRGPAVGIAPRVIAELTRLCGADFVQVGSFTGTVYDTPEDVHAQIDACQRDLGVARAVAVLGGGVGPRERGRAGACGRHHVGADGPARLGGLRVRVS